MKALAVRLLPSQLRAEIRQVLKAHGAKRADRKGICSDRTRGHRREIINQAIAQLWEGGFRLESLSALREKHIEALMERWDRDGLSPSMLHTRLSVLRTLCKWLGKEDVVKDLAHYLPVERTRRTGVATRNLAWEAKGIDLEVALSAASQIDERFGVMLALQRHFGLRSREAIEFQPGASITDGGTQVLVFAGTKGGRPRLVPIETDKQREVMARVTKLVSQSRTGKVRWPDCNYRQARNRYYNWMKRLGATKAGMGVTGHGLRHGYAQEMYRRQTGLPTPIEGGKPTDLSRRDHKMAGMTVSAAMGHGRIDVVASYYGSYGHGQRTVQMPSKMDFCFKP